MSFCKLSSTCRIYYGRIPTNLIFGSNIASISSCKRQRKTLITTIQNDFPDITNFLQISDLNQYNQQNHGNNQQHHTNSKSKSKPNSEQFSFGLSHVHSSNFDDKHNYCQSNSLPNMTKFISPNNKQPYHTIFQPLRKFHSLNHQYSKYSQYSSLIPINSNSLGYGYSLHTLTHTQSPRLFCSNGQTKKQALRHSSSQPKGSSKDSTKQQPTIKKPEKHKEQISDDNSSDTKETKSTKKTPQPKRRFPLVQQATTTWKPYLKYINPIFIGKKLGTLLYNILYVTFDSIIHPKNGLQRIRTSWKHIKEEAGHYWHASKLLWTDIKQASKLLRKLTKGHQLTYRESRQLRRTAIDMLRMIPFAVFILIPFLEFALPIALFLFPGMLPTRFQTSLKKEEDRKKELQLRLNMAHFLEDTLFKFAKDIKQKSESMATDSTERLDTLIHKLRSGEEVTNEQILKVAKLFDDNVTLDNALHSELANMCRYMNLSPFGTTPMLRIRLHSKIRELRREDRGIRKEGVENIPIPLLKQLSRERGMRADFNDPKILQSNLQRWLELSLDSHVPVALLVISRIFTLENITGEDTDAIKNVLSTVTDAAVEEVLVESAGVADAQIEKKVLDRKAKLIEEENTLRKLSEKEIVAYMDRPAAVPKSPHVELVEEDRKKRLLRLATALNTLASDTSVETERNEVNNMISRLKSIVEASDKVEATIEESKVQSMVDEVEKMIADDSKDIGIKKQATITFVESQRTPEKEVIVEAERIQAQKELKREIETAGAMPEEIKIHEEFEQKAEESLEAAQQAEQQMVETIKEEEQAEMETEADLAEIEKAIQAQTKLENRIQKMLTKIEGSIDQTDVLIGDTLKKFTDDENISYDEVKRAVQNNLKSELGLAEEVNVLIEKLDLKKDGKLDKEEIRQVIKRLRNEYTDEDSFEPDHLDDESDEDELNQSENRGISNQTIDQEGQK